MQCKNCGKITKNKFFCCRECKQEYKFKHSRKKRSKLEKYLVKQIKTEFKNLKVISNDREVLHENLELDIYLPDINIAFEINGKMHYEFIKYFHHKLINFINQQVRDNRKRLLCYQNNIQLIIIKNFKVFSEEFAREIYVKMIRPIILNKRIIKI